MKNFFTMVFNANSDKANKIEKDNPLTAVFSDVARWGTFFGTIGVGFMTGNTQIGALTAAGWILTTDSKVRKWFTKHIT